MVYRPFVFVLALLPWCCTAFEARLQSQADIEKAFLADGFNVTKWVTFNGHRGCVAESLTERVLSTNQPKRAYYVEGTGYDMGYLQGLLSVEGTTLMATKYIDRFIPELIVSKWADKLMNNTLWEDVCDVIADFFIAGSNKAFNELYAAGVFPEELVAEMRGIVAAVQDSQPGTAVTFQRLVVINFGMDWFSTKVFSSPFPSPVAGVLSPLLKELQEIAISKGMKPRTVKFFDQSNAPNLKGFFRPPIYCDAFGAKGAATRTGKSVFYARDLQLVTCDIMQDVATLVIKKPTDGRATTVAAATPAMVGGATVLNEAGVVFGVDTLRSAFGNTSWVGLNSIMLLRHAADHAKTTQEAITLMANSQRGCPWLYSVCDVSGDCAIIESGAYDPKPPSSFSPLSYISDTTLLPLLPNASFIDKHNSSSAWRNGMFVRDFDYQYPAEFFDFNPKLFQRAGMTYTPNMTSDTGFIFKTWQEERTAKIGDNYFPPLRAPSMRDFVLVSNVAIVPEMRLTMMSTLDDIFASLTDESPQWRYDKLNSILHEQHGTIDMDGAKDIITFLSPKKTPGYWNHTIIPGDPMSAQIEGMISAANLNMTNLQLWSKTGYWADGWVGVTLNHFA